MPTRDEFDVCVVGSGAGGGTLACALAEAGVRVALVEKGPYYKLKDFAYHDEILIQKRNFFAPNINEEPHMIRRGDEQEFSNSRDGWTANCVGGGTVHFSGFFLRLHREDFEVKSRFGRYEGSTVEDWPIRYEELEPWYDRIEYLLGVSGKAGENPFDVPRRVPYPNPPIVKHPFHIPFDRAAKKLGWHPYTTPRALLSRPYGGRPPCNYCGYCGNFGCEIAAKSSVLSVFIPRAEQTGRLKIISRAMVTEVIAGDDGRARGVRYLDAKGWEQEIKSRVVAVSCCSIESARLLLSSKSKRFPGGLANTSGLVGKNLHFSTFAGVEADFFRTGGAKGFPGFEDKHPFLGRSIQDFYIPHANMKAPVPKAGTVRFDMEPKPPIFRASQVAMPPGRPVLWGQELKDELRRHFKDNRAMEAEIFHEFSPNRDTYVELDPEVRDKYGLPVARITVRLLRPDVEGSRWLQDRAIELFETMGADRTRRGMWGGATFVLQHGTCRFGNDPKSSVLNKYCRAHDVPNLYVVDGSFMPSSGGVPTTLTIQANALRVADHIRESLVKKEL